jgi:hypothetical protein
VRAKAGRKKKKNRERESAPPGRRKMSSCAPGRRPKLPFYISRGGSIIVKEEIENTIKG